MIIKKGNHALLTTRPFCFDIEGYTSCRACKENGGIPLKLANCLVWCP